MELKGRSRVLFWDRGESSFSVGRRRVGFSGADVETASYFDAVADFCELEIVVCGNLSVILLSCLSPDPLCLHTSPSCST